MLEFIIVFGTASLSMLIADFISRKKTSAAYVIPSVFAYACVNLLITYGACFVFDMPIPLTDGDWGSFFQFGWSRSFVMLAVSVIVGIANAFIKLHCTAHLSVEDREKDENT